MGKSMDFFTIFSLAILVIIFHFVRVAMLRSKNYEWYKSEHPDLVKGNRVSCYSCHNNRIHVRNLMNKTFTRAHFCTQCGKNLYYSAE
jgi:hypothetical protein